MNVTLAATLGALLVLAGCTKPPTEQAKRDAADTVGILFTVDGVTVYRFGDGGRYHYFAVRDGRRDTTLTQWDERRSCGKNCTRVVHLEEQIAVTEEPR